MTMRLYADGGTGKVAVYDYTAGDDVPFTTPLSAIGRLKFHSDLPYPAIIDTRSVSVTLPAVASATDESNIRHILFAHGVSGIPYVEGAITSGLSRVVALCGSVPVQVGTGLANSFFRAVHLGADATYVYLNDYCTTYETQGFPALTLGLNVFVLDTVLS